LAALALGDGTLLWARSGLLGGSAPTAAAEEGGPDTGLDTELEPEDLAEPAGGDAGQAPRSEVDEAYQEGARLFKEARWAAAGRQ
jgi:hypothetical protein